ncbi:SNF2-related protein [Streptomyces sp. NPDC051569]|uniref:SNF2-related protein n=1 Tax=Streptomyces sp. NPDC051569 TaxID=3365661 RepID=UPI0037BC1165
MKGPGTAPGDGEEQATWQGAGLYANEDGYSVAGLLSRWLREGSKGRGRCLTLVAGYVSFRGLELLVPALREVIGTSARVRLLIGAEPTQRAALIEPALGDDRDRGVAYALGQSERALRAELDGVPTSASSAWRLHGLRQLLRHPQVECRRWEHRFLHTKAAADRTETSCRAVVGSFNLSLPGLRTSAELGLASQTARQSRATSLMVDRFWEQGAPYDLAGLIDERLCPYPPELVYLRMLLARFGDEVNASPSPLPLKTFQRDGVAKALAVIGRHGGVLLADEVGLGKTYMAGEIIRRCVVAGEGPVLVVCPAHIKQSVWRRRLGEWALEGVHLLSYHQLALRVGRLARGRGQWRQYALIVLDEAHNLRNTNTWRSALLELLGRQSVRPGILMLTATPVQNRGRDLTQLLRIAAARYQEEPGGDEERSRPSFDELERLCERADQLGERERGLLHSELDRLTVRRTRPLITQEYPRDMGALRFPAVRQVPVRYALPVPVKKLFGDVLDAVGHDDALSPEQAAHLRLLRGPEPRVGTLRLAAYKSDSYRLEDAEDPAWLPLLTGLLRMCLLKRIESSVAAFAATASRMAARTRTALEELGQGKVRVHVPQRLRQDLLVFLDGPAGDTSDEEDLNYNTLIDRYLGGERPSREETRAADRDFRYHPAGLFDTRRMRTDLQHDLGILENLAAAAGAAVTHDPKPGVIRQLLARIAENTGSPKTVLFASARVTTTDLGNRLRAAAGLTEGGLQAFHGRIANLGGPQIPSKAHIASALGHFAPLTAADLSSEIGEEIPEDLYDLLLSTDMLAEGVNLQQAAHLIHYDLPWNPKILEQRLGRIDRLGSPHAQITSYTVLPDTGLDLVLRLMDRLMAKTRIAAACVGTPSELFPGAPVEPRNFVELLDHLDRPPTRRGRLPLAEYQRIWLARALRQPPLKEAIDHLPLWSGAIHPGHFAVPGVVYCFSLTQLPGRPATTAFARVYGHPRYEAITLDAARCLGQAHLDLTPLLDTDTQQPVPAAPQPDVAPAELQLVWDLLDYARNQVAHAHAIPDDLAKHRIHLLTWMLLPNRDTPADPHTTSL